MHSGRERGAGQRPNEVDPNVSKRAGHDLRSDTTSRIHQLVRASFDTPALRAAQDDTWVVRASQMTPAYYRRSRSAKGEIPGRQPPASKRVVILRIDAGGEQRHPSRRTSLFKEHWHGVKFAGFSSSAAFWRSGAARKGPSAARRVRLARAGYPPYRRRRAPERRSGVRCPPSCPSPWPANPDGALIDVGGTLYGTTASISGIRLRNGARTPHLGIRPFIVTLRSREQPSKLQARSQIQLSQRRRDVLFRGTRADV